MKKENEIEANWLPIESAPKDGTRLLLVSKGGKQFTGRFEKKFWGGEWVIYGESWDDESWLIAKGETSPTHFMYLPKPPSEVI